MGKIRFGSKIIDTFINNETKMNSGGEVIASDRPSIWDDFTPEQAEKLLNPTTVEYIQVPVELEKIVYVNKPVEVIKYVDKEVIVEKIVTVDVVKHVDREVVVEKLVNVPFVEYVQVPVEVVNPLNKYMVAIIVALGAIIILQGLL